MAKIIRFKELNLVNFVNHKDLRVLYSDITNLSGRNGVGKTSIGTAPLWILYGVDLFGKKFDPSPSNYEFDRVFASLLLAVDGSEQLLAREIEKGKNKFYINDVPVKATEFEAFVDSLFDKEMFLSLYNPSYFFTLHKDKQRDQLMKYVTAPANIEVFTEMSRTSPEQKAKDIKLNPQAEKLSELLKKHDIEQLKALHTDLKNKNDKWHIQAQGSVKTLTEQLRDFGEIEQLSESAIEAIQKHIKELQKKIDSFDSEMKKITERSNVIRDKQAKIDALTFRIEEGKEMYLNAKNELEMAKSEAVQTHCYACGQELTEEGKRTVEATMAEEIQQREVAVKKLADKVNPLILERKALREEYEKLEPLPDLSYTVTELIEQRNTLEKKNDAYQDYKHMSKRLEEAKQQEANYLKAKNDSIFVLDAIKAFKAKEAEIQTEKVQSLFTTLSIRLFKYVKTNDEYVSDFSLQMDGKDYIQLSAGEKIAAGLELTEVLFKQSELIVPTFIDGIESYTGKVAVYDQLITGRAVPGQEFKIETEVVPVEN